MQTKSTAARAVSRALRDRNKSEPAELITAFHESHPESFHDERTIAVVIGCSEEKLQRDRWAGKGLPFVRFGRLVRYRKRDVLGVPAAQSSQSQERVATEPRNPRGHADSMRREK